MQSICKNRSSFSLLVIKSSSGILSLPIQEIFMDSFCVLQVAVAVREKLSRLKREANLIRNPVPIMANVHGGEGDGAEPSASRRNEEDYLHSRVYVIREIYDNENAYENFEQQLERAIGQEYETIVIEPPKLGDETSRWIAVGNWLHKTAVLTGFGSLVAAFVWPSSHYLNGPLALMSTLCTGLYSLSWQFDPCCKYQVEIDSQQLQQLARHNLSNTSPVVLVRKDDTRRKILHTAVTFACLAQVGLRYYYPSVNRIFNPYYSSGALSYSPGSRSLTDKIVVNVVK